MRENFDMETDEKGFTKSIDGHEQDKSQKKYWMYKVNGEYADVMADKYELHDGDHVEWELAVLNQ